MKWDETDRQCVGGDDKSVAYDSTEPFSSCDKSLDVGREGSDLSGPENHEHQPRTLLCFERRLQVLPLEQRHQAARVAV